MNSVTSFIYPLSTRTLVYGGAMMFALGASSRAADYQGAAAVLRQVEERSAVKPAQPEKEDPAARLRKDLADFRKNVASMPPADAARGWLELLDRGAALPPARGRGYNQT